MLNYSILLYCRTLTNSRLERMDSLCNFTMLLTKSALETFYKIYVGWIFSIILHSVLTKYLKICIKDFYLFSTNYTNAVLFYWYLMIARVHQIKSYLFYVISFCSPKYYYYDIFSHNPSLNELLHIVNTTTVSPYWLVQIWFWSVQI